MSGSEARTGLDAPVLRFGAERTVAETSDPRLVEALEAYLRAMEEGKTLDRREVLARYPGLEEELAACLDGLDFVRKAASQMGGPGTWAVSTPHAIEPPATLGGFRLIRQIGSGGMGVVYEAEEMALHRRVALKILPLSAVWNPRQIQRFHKEAEVAAALDHPNIVHVYSAGCDRGVHYYAMRYVEGETLADFIHRQRHALQTDRVLNTTCRPRQPVVGSSEGGESLSAEDSPTEDYDLAGAASSMPPASARPMPAEVGRAQDIRDSTPTTSKMASRRADAIFDAPYFRTIATWGVQAAEALEHAHRAGIIHRDVKPANLILDRHGRLWLADFGLAMTSFDPKLTVSGGLVGTFRYMSPEQISGGDRPLDHRTDVYSLGVTLYELATLYPAFPGSNRRKLFRQIADGDCLRPRQRNAAIPQDLETIILKAMAPEPRHRYATAQALGEDLQRFMDGKPILARPVTRLERLARWVCRNPALAGSLSLATICVLALVLGALALFGRKPPVIAVSYGSAPAKPLAPRTVQLETDPPGATVVFHPLDGQTGEPQPQNAVRPGERTPLKIALLPGRYLVVAIANTAGYTFHEVYREVPSPDAGSPGAYPHQSWKLAGDGTVVLPRVLLPRSTVTEGMARFDGGDDVPIGSRALAEVPPHRRRVPGFWLDTHEVRVRDYRRVLPDGEALRAYQVQGRPVVDDDALALISYDGATAYAEKVGKRLPTEWEYELAATQGGTQAVPWGNDIEKITRWTFGTAGVPSWDRLDTQPPVYGLYSNVAEWTSSWSLPYPKHEKAGLRGPECGNSWRVVRGGPFSVIKGQPQQEDWRRGPRFRVAMLRQTWMPGLGFRGARSLAPRLEAKDFSAPRPE